MIYDPSKSYDLKLTLKFLLAFWKKSIEKSLFKKKFVSREA